jgi:hypothetical protein
MKPGRDRQPPESRHLLIKVVPNASRSEVVGWEDAPGGATGVQGRILRVRLAAPPIDGRANEELVRLLAKAGGVAKGEVVIRHGASGRLKAVQVPARWQLA